MDWSIVIVMLFTGSRISKTLSDIAIYGKISHYIFQNTQTFQQMTSNVQYFQILLEMREFMNFRIYFSIIFVYVMIPKAIVKICFILKIELTWNDQIYINLVISGKLYFWEKYFWYIFIWSIFCCTHDSKCLVLNSFWAMRNLMIISSNIS